MGVLGTPVLLDPATAVTKATSALLAQTAFDTSSARVTFAPPDLGRGAGNEMVIARIRVANKGSATAIPATLLGVLDGATVRGRQAPAAFAKQYATVTGLSQHEAVFVIGGLTAGTTYNFDAAYGVETLAASTNFGYGGPNNATASDAYGPLAYEIWSTPQLLAGKLYDPATAVTKSLATAAAVTAFDTTNLRHTFTVPASGLVMARIRAMASGGTGSAAVVHFGVMNGATVVARLAAHQIWCANTTVAATDHVIYQAEFVVPGLTPGASLTWDAAYGIETAGTGMSIKYGGPNDTTADNAYGGISYELMAA
jgi:hypothetical protein